MATVPRTYHTHQVHYHRKQVAYNTTPTHSITRHLIGKVPAGGQVVSLMATVKTGFSATGTRVITVGSNGTTANNFLTTITEETATAVVSYLGSKLTFSSDTDVFAKITTTGTAAAAGVAEFVVTYTLPVDAN